MKKLFGYCAVIAATLFVGGMARASETDVLNVYSWDNYMAPDTLTRFEAETGIKVHFDSFDSLETLETKILVGGSGYDVIFPAASVLERLIEAQALSPLDKADFQNMGNLDPFIQEKLAAHDPGNKYAIPYTFGTVGLAYNVEAIEARLPDWDGRSLDVLFNPQNLSQLTDCGVAVIDSPNEVLGIVLNYLGKDPYSSKKDDLEQVRDLLMSVRPHFRYINSIKIINDLSEGEICMGLAYSGDAALAQIFAEEAGRPIKIDYRIPSEGTVLWFDTAAIPKAAPHPEAARKFLDFLMRPDVMADITNYIAYANANEAASDLVDPEIRNNPNIYPTAEMRSRLFVDKALDLRKTRIRNRVWTQFKSNL